MNIKNAIQNCDLIIVKIKDNKIYNIIDGLVDTSN